MNWRRRFRKTATATKWRWYIAPGKQHASFTSICAARGSVQSIIIGRAMRCATTTRLAEAEMTAACFGLGGPPHVGRPYRSAAGFNYPITPGGVSARGTRDDLPGAIIFRHFVATGRRNYRHHLLHKLHCNTLRESDEVNLMGSLANEIALRSSTGLPCPIADSTAPSLVSLSQSDRTLEVADQQAFNRAN